MTDDEAGSPNDSEAFARPYDYFKHLTGIALISIGGVFAFMDSTLGLDPRRATIVLGCLALAGVISLLMAGGLASLEVRPTPHATMARRVRYGLTAATFFLAVGLGAFIQTFTSAMFK